MRIIYISESLIPSQFANSVHVLKMCNAMVELGHDVTLIGINNLSDNSDIHKYYGVSSEIKLKLLKLNKLRYVNQIINGLKIKNIVKSLNPDLLIGRSMPGFFFCSDLGIPYIFESHEPILNKNYKLNGKFFKVLMLKKILGSKNIKSFVLISEELKKLYDFEEFPDLNVIVAHDAADKQNSFEIDSNWKKLYPLKNIGYFGSFYQGKGIENFIQIASSYKKAHFHAFGGNVSQIKYFKSIALNNVVFHGYVANYLLEYYRNNMDILLAPFGKRVEAQAGIDMSSFFSPIKIFEYMSAKKPIICSNLPVLKEVLNENNSILLNPDEIEKWNDAINIIIQDEKFAEQISNIAYNDFINKFTWFHRAKNILNKSMNY